MAASHSACYGRHLQLAAETQPLPTDREKMTGSSDSAAAGPKMAALLAAAAEPLPDTPFIALKSDGVVLIYGRDEQAVEAGNLLKAHLDVTVLIKPPAAAVPPRISEFPVARARSARPRAISAPLRSRSMILRSRAVLARRVVVRAFARWRGVALRHRDRPFRRRTHCSRPRICATAICVPIRAIRRRC